MVAATNKRTDETRIEHTCLVLDKNLEALLPE